MPFLVAGPGITAIRGSPIRSWPVVGALSHMESSLLHSLPILRTSPPLSEASPHEVGPCRRTIARLPATARAG